MRAKFIVCFLVILSGCNPAGQEETVSEGNININAPYIWSDKNFPRTLQVSESFTDDEVANILEMSDAWKTALQDKQTFFGFGDRTQEITDSLNSLDSLLDGVLGIYKVTTWPSSISGSALAVTQIFGRRYNVGTSSEFVNIEHADILVNYDVHNFDTGDAGPNYDLRTVMLHEFGHFLGLAHKSSNSGPDDSIMYPSISSSTNKRAPRTVDINDLTAKYDINLNPGGVAASAMATNKEDYSIDPHDSGEAIKILIELHADGECTHRVNGTVIGRHQLKEK